MAQELHLWQVLTEISKGELEINEIESENVELDESLFDTILKGTRYDSKILSIARIN